MRRGPNGGAAELKNTMAKAREAWGADMPEWVAELAGVVERGSQGRAAKRIGYSASVVSAVLSKTYIGSYETVEKSVRGALMGETLQCPVLGAITKSTCLDHQKKAQAPFSNSSSMRIAISRMCRSGDCPHSRIGGHHG